MAYKWELLRAYNIVENSLQKLKENKKKRDYRKSENRWEKRLLRK